MCKSFVLLGGREGKSNVILKNVTSQAQQKIPYAGLAPSWPGMFHWSVYTQIL